MRPTYQIVRLEAGDEPLLAEMMTLFGTVFDEMEIYTHARPSQAYHRRLLSNPYFVALAARADKQIVGALAGYELAKFEQERSEFYIYDLAVDPCFRRQGIATALIMTMKKVAAAAGGYLIFVQADQGDTAPMTLYGKLGRREDIHHYDIVID